MTHLQLTPSDPVDPADAQPEDLDSPTAGEAGLRQEEILRAEDEGMTELAPEDVAAPDVERQPGEPWIEAPGAPGPDAAELR